MAKIQGMRLSGDKAVEILREVADDSSRLIITNHAETRMKQRRITRTQILRCLRHGTITEQPSWMATKGTWELRIEYVTAGDALTVGAAIDPAALVIVITAF